MVPSRTNETIGFIDIGTNSIHLSVVRYYGTVPGDTVFQDKEMLRLGRGLYSDSFFFSFFLFFFFSFFLSFLFSSFSF